MLTSSGVDGMVKTNSKKDKELMLKIAGYDKSALEQLYDRYAPLLFSFINVIAHNKELAENILIDVFLILWKRIDDFDFRTNNIYTWLVTLSRNKTVDVLKRLKGNTDLPEYDDNYEKMYILPKLSHEIASLDFDIAFKLKEKIQEEFKKLTDAQRYVLNLIYFEGLSETEVASRLNIPAPTVRTKLQVAMGNLFEKIILANRN